jgi:hypothetical protein
MSLFQVQIPLGNSPVSLTCFSDGTVGFVPVMVFTTVVEEYIKDKFTMYDMQGFSINGKQYNYNTRYSYKTIPDMLEYLQSLKLEMPQFRQGF